MTVVIWIDWYAYHHARLRSLTEHPRLRGKVQGIELVGKSGVHKGMVFREEAESTLPVSTLLPGANWTIRNQVTLAVLLWKKLSDLGPRMVLVPGYYNIPGLTAALWAKLHGKQSVLMTESSGHDQPRTAWKERLKSSMLRILFDAAITGGKAHRRYLRQLDFPSDHVAKCYDVVDNDFFSEQADHCRRNTQSPVQAPYFLYVGRFAPEKNLKTLVEAYMAYRQNGGDWGLVLVGGGPEEAELRALTNDERIHFAGLKTSRELPNYYAHAGAFVLPSVREPWGLVANEALASGLPLIVSTPCGCREDLLEEGRNGFSFQPMNVPQLERCLADMAALSRTERQAMSERSREIIVDYSPQRWADEVAGLLDGVRKPLPALQEAIR